MAHIFYSMAGEGRGHATRARTVIENLRTQGHTVTAFAPEFAWRMLNDCYEGSDVQVKRLPGLMFHYHKERLSFTRTIGGTVSYLAGLPSLVRSLRNEIQQAGCDLVITDFEPSIARAARAENIPWMSLDHQHFLIVSDFSGLSMSQRMKTWAMGLAVRQYYGGQHATVVSSFYFPPLKPAYESVVQCGVLLRKQIVEATPEKQNHLVVYLRRFAPPHLLEALGSLGCEVRIYGMGHRPAMGSLKFLPVSEDGFLEDLQTCKALISNAGNQLVGEALYLDKPVLVFPEDRNFEQEINAHYLCESGGGESMPLAEASAESLNAFVERCDGLTCNIPQARLNGNHAAMQVVNRLLRDSGCRPVNIAEPVAAAGSRAAC